VKTDYTYDVRNRPTQIKTTKNSSDLLNLTYTYDPAGNILQMKDSPNGQLKEHWDFTYDSLNRLITAVSGPQGDSYSLSYVYDSTGNRIQLNNTVYTYNEMNELLTQENGTNYTYTYDDHGNCTTKTDGNTMWEYLYNYEIVEKDFELDFRQPAEILFGRVAMRPGKFYFMYQGQKYHVKKCTVVEEYVHTRKFLTGIPYDVEGKIFFVTPRKFLQIDEVMKDGLAIDPLAIVQEKQF